MKRVECTNNSEAKNDKINEANSDVIGVMRNEISSVVSNEVEHEGNSVVTEWDETDIKYMKEALKQAKKAAKIEEVPIGCVIVHDGKIIGRGYNRRNIDKSTLGHAEITAIKRASKAIGDWRLEECVMYVTLEPCQMCAGAIVQARIPKVVIGSMNAKAGCAGSIINILEMPQFNHQVHVVRGVLVEECSQILKDFFKKLRDKKKELKKAEKANREESENR